MAKHTPGPWRQNEHGNLVCYPDGLEVGILSSQLPKEEREANARLIAAAPDLLDSLQHLSNVYEHIWVKMSDGEMAIVKGAWEVAEMAIAKAEGRS